MSKPAVSPEHFSSLGELLKYLRRRAELTQGELAMQVGYSDTQISRIEQNQRTPDSATLLALFVPALHLERAPEWVSRLLELAKQARLGVAPDPKTAGASKPKHNLPVLLTTFIGREQQQKEIIELIAQHRLVTLTGSGGIGKTRTSLSVGKHILDEYANGVWLIELAALSDPALVPQTVASAFGLGAQSDVSHTQVLVTFLRAKTMLLILDNCEHLLDAAAALADTLLKHCPQVKILATSREALGILGEIRYRLPSLGLPDIQQTLERFRAYESVRLFEERARLAQPDFTLTLENAAAITQICSRLDGIPLAIELAAARVALLSVAQIAARLDDRFSLLAGGSRTDLPRQQTIRASIDWSWNLLSDAERTVLRRLTVFVGGWVLNAAEFVCGDTGVDTQQVSELLGQLVAKSLVVADPPLGRERRFHLHETIRQYAREKLVEASEAQHTYERHLGYVLELSESSEPALHGPQQMEWVRRINQERENIRAALDHAAKTDLEAGLALSGHLIRFWRYGHFDLGEGLRWVSELVRRPESHAFPLARAKARYAQGQFLWNMQRFDTARSIAEECLAAFRAHGDRQGEFFSLMLLGDALQFLESMERKTEIHLQALALARTMADIWLQAIALENLGWDQRDPARGQAFWKESITLLRRTGDRMILIPALAISGFTFLLNGELDQADHLLSEAYAVNREMYDQQSEFVLTGQAILASLRGEYGQARAFLQANIDALAEAGNRLGYAWGRARLAYYVALREGSVAEAHHILVDVIEEFHAGQNKSGLAFVMDKLAGLFVVIDKPEAAARLIGWSDATRKEIGDPRPRLEQVDVEQDIAAIIAKIGVAPYDMAYAAGQSMPLDRAVAYAVNQSW